MTSAVSAPHRAPILAFHHPDGSVVTLGELDPQFLAESGIGPSAWERPFRVEIQPQVSKRGNTFFSYEQGGIPLPDGLETELRIDGERIHPSEVSASKRGNPTRQHTGSVTVGIQAYDVTAYVARTRSSFWIKVHLQVASKRPQLGRANEPRGGRLV